MAKTKKTEGAEKKTRKPRAPVIPARVERLTKMADKLTKNASQFKTWGLGAIGAALDNAVEGLHDALTALETVPKEFKAPASRGGYGVGDTVILKPKFAPDYTEYGSSFEVVEVKGRLLRVKSPTTGDVFPIPRVYLSRPGDAEKAPAAAAATNSAAAPAVI